MHELEVATPVKPFLIWPSFSLLALVDIDGLSDAGIVAFIVTLD